MMGVTGEKNYYPYRQKANTSFKINNLKRVTPDLQMIYLLILVTNEMYFYGEDRKSCPVCLESLE